MSNKDYDSKKKWFFTAKYAYTTDLCKIDKWDIACIEERGEQLAMECLKIGPLPAEYQDGSAQVQTNERRAGFRFSMVGIEKGTIITFSKYHSIKVVVADHKNVEYQGEKYSLTSLACKLTRKDRIEGPRYFLYRSKSLGDLRAEMEEDQAFDGYIQRTLDIE